MAKPRKAPTSSIIQNAVYMDERFLSLTATAQLAYVASLGQVDTFGNMTADFAKLRTYILPMHNFSEADMRDICNAFVDAGLAFYYERNGGTYIHLYLTANRRIEAPECPLPPGLTAKKPEGKSRRLVYQILDDDGNECDPDGDPLDKQVDRVAPDYRNQEKNGGAPPLHHMHARGAHEAHTMNTDVSPHACSGHNTDMQVVQQRYTTDALNRREEKGKEENIPFPSGKGHACALTCACAGATLGGSPAPAPCCDKDEGADADNDTDTLDPEFSRMTERATKR